MVLKIFNLIHCVRASCSPVRAERKEIISGEPFYYHLLPAGKPRWQTHSPHRFITSHCLHTRNDWNFQHSFLIPQYWVILESGMNICHLFATYF